MFSFGFVFEIPKMHDIQRRFSETVREFTPTGSLGRAVKNIIQATHREAVAVSHVDTGALKSSHLQEVAAHGHDTEGRVYINTHTANPRHRVPVRKYGPVEHDRGGSHAFYERAFTSTTIPEAFESLQYIIRGVDVHWH